MKREIKTEKAPAAPDILSQAIVCNGFVFTSGQIPLTGNGALVEGTTQEQTHQIMKNLGAILEASDASFEDVVKTTLYVTDMSIYADVNDVYIEYMREPYPARELVCVKSLPLGAAVEISMVAYRK